MEKPNLIFVLTDDQAQWALGAYGNEDIHTPNMDRLAKEGMLFTRAFTAPVCSPSRCSMVTGWYPHVRGHRTLWHLLRPDELDKAKMGIVLGDKVVHGSRLRPVWAEERTGEIFDIKYFELDE